MLASRLDVVWQMMYLKRAYKSYLLAILVLYAVDFKVVKQRLQPKPLSYYHMKE